MRAHPPLIMGIINATPDSFSDGGLFFDTETAVTHGMALIEQGADILDIGGESTRPGSVPLNDDEEMARVIPVIEQLLDSKQVREKVLISVDTTKPTVAHKALQVGAKMINDVSMLRQSDELARVAARFDADLVLMHSRRTPADMQDHIEYRDLIGEVKEELKEAAAKAQDAGVSPERIWIDPGIGFAKTAEQCVELLANLPSLATLGYKILVGPSRKSFIGRLTGAEVNDRLGGTAAAVTASVLGGARALRVHDVGMMRQAALVAYEMTRTLKDA